MTTNTRHRQSHYTKNNDSSQEGRYQVYAQWRNAVYEALIESDMTEDSTRWIDCETVHRSKWSRAGLPEQLPAKTNYVMVCSDKPEFHSKIIQKHTCGLRYCPTCSEMHSARLVSRYVPYITKLAVKSSRYRLRHIILTTPYSLDDDNIKEKYKQHQKNILALFDELLPKTWRKKQGFLVGDEFGESGNKLHSHILHFGQYIEKQKLTDAWLKVTGGECQINYVRGIDPDEKSISTAVQEVLKYCTKFWRNDADGNKKMIDPYLIPQLAQVLKGQRRIRTYGLFYGIPKPDPVEKECLCPDCNQPQRKIWRSDWQTFVNTGMTQKKLEFAGKKQSLDSITANKSVSEMAKIREKPPDKPKMLPIFDKIPYQHD